MMREIIFRWWDFAEEEMLSENDIDNAIVDTGEDGYFHFLKVARYHPMQYTGLKDKNDVKIYEGDVVNVNSFGGTPRYEKVAFYTNAGFAGIHPFTDSGHHWSSKNCEIVGNIYGNPALLGGRQ